MLGSAYPVVLWVRTGTHGFKGRWRFLGPRNKKKREIELKGRESIFIERTTPTKRTKPTNPTKPTKSTKPTKPTKPTKSTKPTKPTKPS